MNFKNETDREKSDLQFENSRLKQDYKNFEVFKSFLQDEGLWKKWSKENPDFINSDIDLSKIALENYCEEGDLVIADASDGNHDSAVFLAANSFTAGQSVFVEAHVEATNSNNAYENCYYGYYTFTRSDTTDIR